MTRGLSTQSVYVVLPRHFTSDDTDCWNCTDTERGRRKATLRLTGVFLSFTKKKKKKSRTVIEMAPYLNCLKVYFKEQERRKANGK